MKMVEIMEVEVALVEILEVVLVGMEVPPLRLFLVNILRRLVIIMGMPLPVKPGITWIMESVWKTIVMELV